MTKSPSMQYRNRQFAFCVENLNIASGLAIHRSALFILWLPSGLRGIEYHIDWYI